MLHSLRSFILLAAMAVLLADASRAAPFDGVNLSSPLAVAEARASFPKEKRQKTIGEALAKPLSKETAKEWQGAFWAAELLQEKTPLVRDAIASVLDSWSTCDQETQRCTLEAAYTLFPSDFEERISSMLPAFKEPKHFAMAVYYLLRTSSADSAKSKALTVMDRDFPDWQSSGILIALRHRLTTDAVAEISKRPPLVDLLAADFAKGAPVLFSFQRLDRRYPGMAVVKLADGKFARREDGSLFSISQLAMAMSDLPGTITNGNTPQGIFTINGTDVTTNVFMGPTPFLLSALPVEESVTNFFHDPSRAEEKWSLETYRALLPPTWKDYFPILEAYNAGIAGRSEILVHGTAADPDFTKGEPFYPATPTLGCLCAFEAWSPVDGRLIASDQFALLHAFALHGDQKGFLVVVNLDDQKRPITLYDVLPELLKAEE